jgi:hypothetical protein
MKEAGEAGSQEIKACWARMEASAEYQALKDKVGSESGPILAMKVNPQKATPEEAAQVLALHQGYITPCRKLSLETAARINSAIVSVLASTYTKSDANYANLVTYRITWGEFVTQSAALLAQRNAELAEVGREIQRGLEQSHNAEVSRRQAAASALSTWAYQQQVLIQNQQMINTMNQPRMTNCQYVGRMLNCTSF